MTTAMHALIQASHTIAASEHAVNYSWRTNDVGAFALGVLGCVSAIFIGRIAGAAFRGSGRVFVAVSLVGCVGSIVTAMVLAPNKAGIAKEKKAEQSLFFACAKGSKALSSIDATTVKTSERSVFFKAQNIVRNDCGSAN